MGVVVGVWTYCNVALTVLQVDVSNNALSHTQSGNSLNPKVLPTYSWTPSPSLIYRAAVERVKTPCLHLSPEPYQYSWVCRVRLCDGCLISLWSPCARPVGALMRQQQSSVWSVENSCLHWSPYTFFAIYTHVHTYTDAAHRHMNTCVDCRTALSTVWPQHCNNCKRIVLITAL